MLAPCPQCGFRANREQARFCRNCGHPLERGVGEHKLEPPTGPAVPAEAMAHFMRATAVDLENADRDDLVVMAEELEAAISKANGVFADAHAYLGIALMMLEAARRARREFHLAIEQDESNVIAYAMLVLLDLEGLGMPRGLRAQSGTWWMDLAALGVSMVVAKSKVRNLSNRVDRLVAAFSRRTRTTDRAEAWIGMSELLLHVNEAVSSIPAMPRKDRLARAVLEAPWERVGGSPAEMRQVESVRSRAQDRLALLDTDGHETAATT